MKNLTRSLLLKSLVLTFVVWISSCSQNEEEPIIASENQIEADVITSAEELNALILKEGGDPSQLSLDEKMSFLSNHIASQYISQNSSTTSRSTADEIVSVAQIFDGTTFFTDVEVGPDTQRVAAFQSAAIPVSSTFAGANANIYRNGVNIDGKITSANPSTLCEDFDDAIGIDAFANADYRPTSLSTMVSINCFFD